MRLSKIAKDFNIGIQTLIDFIEKNTNREERWSPMSQVPDDLYDLICKEFPKPDKRDVFADILVREQIKASTRKNQSISDTNSKNAIGFKNFRRFENFPTMELGDITMLVGGNNSGKSTMVKAALLVKNFVNSKNIDIFGDGYSNRPRFNFDVPHTYIGSFKKALFANAKDNHIVFEYQDAGVKYCIVVSGDKEQKDKAITYGYVDSFSMEILDTVFALDFDTMHMSASFQPEMKPMKNKQYIREDVEYTKERIQSLKVQLAKETNFETIVSLKKEIEILEDEVLEDENPAIRIELPISTIIRPYFNYFVYDILEQFEQYGTEPISWQVEKNSAEYKRIQSEKQAIQERSKLFFHIRLELTKSIEHAIEYIHAHNASQEVFFKSFDRNDAMAQILHSFMRLRIQADDTEHKFVQEWMRKFEIGENFEITSYDGEAYSIDVVDSNGLSMPLGSKGMGSIQVMTLLLQLAGYIKRYKAVRFEKPTILIEEPEQNLHPKLQSLLVELFWELSKRPYGFHFVIETHSEYLIRKSQVITAEEIAKNVNCCEKWRNPFKVYYFPHQGVPYDMKYQDNGRFENKFGEGFFDVSSGYSIQLNKLERSIKAKE